MKSAIDAVARIEGETAVNAKQKAASVVQIRPLYLTRPDAAAYLAVSESLLDALVARGDAPKPRKLSAGRTAWLVEDLDEWGRERPLSDILPPKGCGFGRAGKGP